MKLILSRKGFDTSAGGCASPIFPNGRLVSLPIPLPAPLAKKRFVDIRKPLGAASVDLATVVQHLTVGHVRPGSLAHLDPDLDPESLPRLPGWRPTFGQTGAAQSHLADQRVGPGDVFLFFGWFREVEAGVGGQWSFLRGSRDLHVVFGWMQIGQTITIDQLGRERLLRLHPWLRDHPHVYFGPDPRNTLYVAAERLILDGQDTGLPGAGEVGTIRQSLVMTAPEATRRGLWRLPAWFAPQAGRSTLTYHGDPARWVNAGPDELRLDLVNRGQEFVLDCADRPDATAWLSQLLKAEVPDLALCV